MCKKEASSKGGQTTKERYGTPYFREIGRMGGEKVRDERGREFYEEIGRKGAAKIRELIEAGKKAKASEK